MRYATEHCDDMLLLELIDDQLKGYGLEIVQVDNVGGTNYWFIKVAGQETHAPGRYMDWNEVTLEIPSEDAETGHAAVAAARSAQCLGTCALTR